MVQLVRAGPTPEELADEFEPSAQTIRNWDKQADLDAGRRTDGLTTEERDELRRLRREVKQLRIEREILKKPRPGLLGRRGRCPRGIRVREGESGQLSGAHAVQRIGCLPQRVLRVAPAIALGAGGVKYVAAGTDPRDPQVQPPDLRSATDLCGVAGRGRRGESQAGGPPDEAGGARRREPPLRSRAPPDPALGAPPGPASS